MCSTEGPVLVDLRQTMENIPSEQRFSRGVKSTHSRKCGRGELVVAGDRARQCDRWT